MSVYYLAVNNNGLVRECKLLPETDFSNVSKGTLFADSYGEKREFFSSVDNGLSLKYQEEIINCYVSMLISNTRLIEGFSEEYPLAINTLTSITSIFQNKVFDSKFTPLNTKRREFSIDDIKDCYNNLFYVLHVNKSIEYKQLLERALTAFYTLLWDYLELEAVERENFLFLYNEDDDEPNKLILNTPKAEIELMSEFHLRFEIERLS